MISAGVSVVCFAVANPGKDIFLDMLEIELDESGIFCLGVKTYL